MAANGVGEALRQIDAKFALHPDEMEQWERDFLIIHTLKRLDARMSKPFWASWRPREIATAVLGILVAVGALSADAVTRAMMLLGG